MSFSQQLLAEAIKAHDNASGIGEDIYNRLIDDIKSNQDKYDKYNGPLNAKDLCWKLYSEIFQKPYSECVNNSWFFEDVGKCKENIPSKFSSEKDKSDYIELVNIPRDNMLNQKKEAFLLQQHADPFVFGKGPVIPGFFQTWFSVILIILILILLIFPFSSTIKFWGILVSGLVLLVREGFEAYNKRNIKYIF